MAIKTTTDNEDLLLDALATVDYADTESYVYTETITINAITPPIDINLNNGDDEYTGNSTVSETINGLGGNDILDGGAINKRSEITDTLNGGTGDDILRFSGRYGHGVFNGGDGSDTIDFSTPSLAANNYRTKHHVGAYVNLEKNIAYSQYNGESDKIITTKQGDIVLSSIENAIGTDQADRLMGNGEINVLTGGNGDDIYGVNRADDVVLEKDNEGIDTVESTSASYTLANNVENLILMAGAKDGHGNAVDNIIIGNIGSNTLNGNDGNDTLDSGAIHIASGNDITDTLNGGKGNDFLRFSGLYGKAVFNGGDGEDYGENGTDTVDFSHPSTETNIARKKGVGVHVDLDANPDNNPDDGIDQHYGIANAAYRYGEVLDGYGKINLTSIENVIGTNQDDWIKGDVKSNVLNGGDGNDYLDGGAGIDTLIGGNGDDTYVVDNTDDIITETMLVKAKLKDAGGHDTVQSSADSYTLSNYIEDLELKGSDNINGTGNDGNNLLIGNDGNNILDGGAGKDTMLGGNGDDTYIVDNAGDVVKEIDITGNPTSGNDTVESSATYSLTYKDKVLNAIVGNGVENLILTGTNAINGTGNELNNTLIGNAASNVLDGGVGNDILDGGAVDVKPQKKSDTVTDKLIGNYGDDTFLHKGLYGNGSFDGGDGIDVLDLSQATESAMLQRNNDHAGVFVDLNKGDSYVYYRESDKPADRSSYGEIKLTNIEDVIGTNQDDWIKGDINSNKLYGGDGNDTLDSGADNEQSNELYGGSGNDIYIIDQGDDVIEYNTDGDDTGGDDTVKSTATYTLQINLENLTLIGTAKIDGMGNELNNIIIGNDKANTLDGGTGADTLIGGDGNDTYIIDDKGDIVEETTASDGNDTVISSIDYTLGAFIENLTLTANAIIGNGNDLANTLVGNDYDNILDGRGGADKMSGGKGNDTYYVDHQGDNIVEVKNEIIDGVNVGGIDTVISSISFFFDAENDDFVENLTLTGNAVINGSGNKLDNILIGNDQANILKGLAGHDILNGGGGDDTLEGGADNDILEGGTGNDRLKGGTGDDTYRFDSGSGIDTILDDGGNDVIRLFWTGQIQNQKVNNDLYLKSGSDTVIIEDWYKGTSHQIESILLSDGSLYNPNATTASTLPTIHNDTPWVI